VRLSEAVYKELLNDYQGAILTAFREVNDALVSIQKLRELQAAQAKLVRTSQDYASYAWESYNSGFASYLTVMDAENKLYKFQNRQAATQGDLFNAMVDIYKAMGGGWVEQAGKLAAVTAR
jgi:multidrug efflux system outer membrane protein